MGWQKVRGLLVQLPTDSVWIGVGWVSWNLGSSHFSAALFWGLVLQVSWCTFSNSLKSKQNPPPPHTQKTNTRAFKIFLWFEFHIDSSFGQVYATFAIYRVYPWEWCSGVTEINFKNHHVINKFTVQFGDSLLVFLVDFWPVGHFLDSLRANNRSKCWAKKVCTPLE